jgi:TonB family protein
MRRLLGIALFLISVNGILNGQQAAPAITTQTVGVQPDHVKVFTPGPDVTAPELISVKMPVAKDQKCKVKPEGMVTLAVIVDAEGRPRNLAFLSPLGDDLDQLAMLVVKTDLFKPGVHEGAPVAVGQSVEVSMEGCVVEVKDETGKKSYRLLLNNQPVQKFGPLPQPLDENLLTVDKAVGKDTKSGRAGPSRVGGSVSAPVVLNSAPVVLNSVEAEFSDEARSTKFQGVCLLSVIIDQNGKPQNIRILRPLGHGLDQKAMEAVSKYRFKPAMRNGKPVPVMITVEVDFRLT